MAKVSKSFEDLYDLMLRDQFLHVCSQDLKLFLKERLPENLTRMANLADQYKDARDLNALQATGKGKMPLAKKVDQVKKTDVGENKHVPNDKKRFIPKTERVTNVIGTDTLHQNVSLEHRLITFLMQCKTLDLQSKRFVLLAQCLLILL